MRVQNDSKVIRITGKVTAAFRMTGQKKVLPPFRMTAEERSG
jgi:hypothetical protein